MLKTEIQGKYKLGFFKTKFSFDTAEFFIDALGSLHIGSCSDIIVSHASKIKLPWSETDSQKAYNKFRYKLSSGDANIHKENLYFKNRFKCMTSQWTVGTKTIQKALDNTRSPHPLYSGHRKIQQLNFCWFNTLDAIRYWFTGTPHLKAGATIRRDLHLLLGEEVLRSQVYSLQDTLLHICQCAERRPTGKSLDGGRPQIVLVID